MEDQQPSQEPTSKNGFPETKQTFPKLSRRGFLQGAIISAAVASGAGALSLSGTNTVQGQTEATPTAVSTPAPTATPITLPPIEQPTLTQETWIEPWIWRPGDWPGQQLHMNVVENENPGPAEGLGNPNPILFSYGGITPGPTIRMRGNETLLLKLRNMLGEDTGITPVKEYPDLAALGPASTPNKPNPFRDRITEKATEKSTNNGNYREDWCLGEHTNGLHSTHVTNLHTHGLHVRPSENPDGTQSDNVILRIMPQADYRRRLSAEDPSCRFLRPNEQVGEGNYEFRLGDVMRDQRQIGQPPQPHPPGTHWYHPHSHGATHNQVASGMAGFLIIEGDVDEAINTAITGSPVINPEQKSSNGYDYRERLMLIQRVFLAAADADSPNNELKKPKQQVAPTVNGLNQPKTITMRPGAVERWRVLNGSVDGRGYKRFMVLAGEYGTNANGRLSRFINESELDSTPMTLREIEDAKVQLYQLAMDGVTLVDENGDYFVKDLATQGEQEIVNSLVDNDDGTVEGFLNYIEACFASPEAVKNAYMRPNEVYMAPANRTDLFFQAPSAGVYTVVAKSVMIHGDQAQLTAQTTLTGSGNFNVPQDIVVAYVSVSGAPFAPNFNVVNQINAALPSAPPYLQPITDEELEITEAEAERRGKPEEAGLYRTRDVSYSGWGSADYPLVTTELNEAFREFVETDMDKETTLENLVYAEVNEGSGVYSLLAPLVRTMAINHHFSAGATTPPRKFDPTDPDTPHMLTGSAEEWALYNNSITLWGDPTVKPEGQYAGHFIGYPVTRGEGQARFRENPEQFQIMTKAVDHPFHIHINPFHVLRLEVPDQDGNLVNILDEPRWQDVIWIPRNGGRIVFRSRFPDYIGVSVNHCHILQHEDNGMMQIVTYTQLPEDANYVARPAVTTFSASEEEANEVFRRPTLEESYGQSTQFVDPNNTGQVFPGFPVPPPELDV